MIANITARSYDMKGHAKKCVERYFELAHKRIDQLYKVFTLCVDDHQFKKEELETAAEMSKVCLQIVLKCLYLARIGGSDILWSVHKLQEQSRGGRARVLSGNIVMWDLLLNSADLG